MVLFLCVTNHSNLTAFASETYFLRIKDLNHFKEILCLTDELFKERFLRSLKAINVAD